MYDNHQPRYVYFLDSDDRASLDSALDSEVVKRATTGHQSNQIRSLFSSGTKDPLSLIDEILSKYTSDQTLRADQAAKEIEKSKCYRRNQPFMGLDNAR